MPLYGPTPMDWASQQAQSRDEQMRQMMNMMLAAKQYQQQEKHYQTQLAHQTFQEQEQMYRDELMARGIEQRENPQGEFEKTYEYLLRTNPQMAALYAQKNLVPSGGSAAQEDLTDMPPDIVANVAKAGGFDPRDWAAMPNAARKHFLDLHKSMVTAKEARTPQYKDPWEQQKDLVEYAISFWQKEKGPMAEGLAANEAAYAKLEPRVLDKSDPLGNRMVANPEYEKFLGGPRKKYANVEKTESKLLYYRAKLASGQQLDAKELAHVQGLISDIEGVRTQGPEAYSPGPQEGDVAEDANGNRIVLRNNKWVPMK